MENQIVLIAFRCWDCYLKPFLIAAILGILAGACFGSLAHAAQGGNAKPLTDNATDSNQIASSGRIRQQAQRIAKLYQQIGMGLEAERARRQVMQATRQWFFFEQSLAGMNNLESNNPKNVATSSERILEVLDELSIQYARAGDATVPARSERNS